MNSSRLEEDKIIKDVRNLFTLNKKTDDTTIKDIRNRFRLKNVDDTTIKDERNIFRLKKIKAIKDRILRDIRNLFEHEDYYEPVTIGKFRSKNYIEYKSNGYKKLSVKEYLNKIKPYYKDIIDDPKKSDMWKLYFL